MTWGLYLVCYFSPQGLRQEVVAWLRNGSMQNLACFCQFLTADLHKIEACNCTGDPLCTGPGIEPSNSFFIWGELSTNVILYAGVRETKCSVYSAHQTGSCCLGTSRERSPLDPSGECWDVANLYVADGSSLPTGPGMLTLGV
jgi:choline dehydrogenase-like flavoprotein